MRRYPRCRQQAVTSRRLWSPQSASRATTLEALERRELLAADFPVAIVPDSVPGIFVGPMRIDAELNDEALVRISVQPTDLVGNPIASIPAGSDFLLQADVQDIRQPANPIAGVFAASLNVTYDPALATIDPAAVLSFDPFFSLAQTFDLSTPGAVNSAGAFASSLTPPGNAPQKFWTAPVQAASAGLVTFTPSFDTSPFREVLLYDPVDPLLAEQIDFVGAALEILAVPEISVDDVSAAEGDASLTSFVFSVSLSEEIADVATVAFATADGEATAADSDYLPISGTLTFLPGQTLKFVTVEVVGDVVLEASETFLLELANPLGATLGNNPGTGTILNDDPLPALSVNNVSAAEGDVGMTDFVFEVTLSGQSQNVATVAFATADGEATAADSDYLPISGTLTFLPGQTVQLVTVEVVGDVALEADETFLLELSNPVGAAPAANSGLGTIFNDDVVTPVISVNDVSLLEGDVGDTFFEFVISLSEPTAGPVMVTYATAPGTATPGVDYLSSGGTVVIPAGQTQVVVSVEVLGDTFVEPDETFFFDLSSPVGATLADPQGKGTILDDDGVTLILNGTDRRDRVNVNQWGKRLQIRSNFGNVTVDNADTLVKIIFNLKGGNDRLIVNSNVKVPIIAHGGAGNDLLKAGGGPSVLLGEEGNDRLIGGRARDILIGGLGADLLMGGLGEDILINGTTNFDQDDMALWELMDVWNNDNIYEARMRQIQALQLIVIDDLDSDRLVGSFGRDWFFYDPRLDTIPDRRSNEAVN